jgi:hypothetical protein
MTKIIQYASQLFLSFESSLKAPHKIVKPVAATLVLAGNSFCCGSPHNKQWLQFLSNSWTDVCIVPGILEHSWRGLTSPTEIDECEKRLRGEISHYSNIHYLNRNSINLSNGLRISGAIKWPESIASPDAAFIKHKYGLRPDFWKEEDDEWIRDAIVSATGEADTHIMVTHYSPLPYMLKEADRNLEASLYQPLLIYPQSLAGWIYGSQKATTTGYCPHRQTFLGSNSRDGGSGYCPEMIMCV